MKGSVFPVKRNWKAEQYGKRIVGVIGAGHGVGTTHTAIMSAGYLSGVCQRSCAVLEWNHQGTLVRLRRACVGDGAGRFRILDVDYYPDAGLETLVLCKALQYQEVIVDYGTISEENQEEFLRCDRRLLLAGLSEWQQGAFLETAGAWRKAGISWETLAVFGSEEARKHMEKGLGLRIRRVPVSVDVFAITESVLEFYQQIL